ncbi:hypothetical protein BCR34DRAFT_271431 [Clohesyomyces aquaticus]|uniref:Uncharacterized protein n=1 Tax=Clohesyomyces aquaticus TaxID=1231657 RepID=A0A1Y1Y1H7_9PLEO|nr:hypothetical protein BCR34DRAFT_271431 [Clohesyomyces aquaticus]
MASSIAAAAASDAPTLMSIPLELRHNIFEFTALRQQPAKKLLRAWFEKKDLAEQTAALATKDPAGTAPRVVAHDDTETDSDEVQNEDDEDIDEDEEDNGLGEEEENDDQAMDDDNDEAMMDADGDGDGATLQSAQTAAAPPAPVISAAPKWRHIPKFMRISHCPPALELLLTSKDLSRQAMDWYYDVAVLRIDATGSFTHTTFFEVSLGELTDAAFSPIENIRRVDVTFVWDTVWLRESDAFESIYQAMLRQRAEFVVGILKRAPELTNVTIHWHDSVNDDESEALKLDVLEGFLTFSDRANVKLEEHYLAPGEEPDSKSLAGMQRMEFQRILDGGHNFR